MVAGRYDQTTGTTRICWSYRSSGRTLGGVGQFPEIVVVPVVWSYPPTFYAPGRGSLTAMSTMLRGSVPVVPPHCFPLNPGRTPQFRVVPPGPVPVVLPLLFYFSPLPVLLSFSGPFSLSLFLFPFPCPFSFYQLPFPFPFTFPFDSPFAFLNSLSLSSYGSIFKGLATTLSPLLALVQIWGFGEVQNGSILKARLVQNRPFWGLVRVRGWEVQNGSVLKARLVQNRPFRLWSRSGALGRSKPCPFQRLQKHKMLCIVWMRAQHTFGSTCCALIGIHGYI